MRVRFTFAAVLLLALTVPSAALAEVAPSLLGSGAQLNGNVYDASGTGAGGYNVAWMVGTSGGAATTSISGFYNLTGVPAAAGNGMLMVDSPMLDLHMMRSGATWPDAGVKTYDFAPGRVSTWVNRAFGVPNAGDWEAVDVALYGADASSDVMTDQRIEPGTLGENIVAEPTMALPGSYTTATCNFWSTNFSDEGIELPVALTASSGLLSAGSLTFEEGDAMRTWVNTIWRSGKPGTKIPIVMENFPPTGWVTEFSGYSRLGHKASRGFGASETPFNGVKYVTVPTTAPAGYQYMIGLQHAEGPLYMETAFQVCTLNATSSTIRHGSTIKLSGRIPTASAAGTLPGVSKRVYLYKSTSSTIQPSSWVPSKSWTLVGSFKTSTYGKFTSPKLKPTRSTSYVLRYPGDSRYWQAFTSVRRIKVY